MVADPKCTALAAAKARAGLSYGQIATQLGEPENRIVAICTGQAVPTDQEFNKLAQVLGIKDQPSHTGVHATAG
ncbi:hypothetical protein NLI96_g3601 [Meripilus lineatus]|uniref:HTH cro/C1-type domain-containing protein n=1 Tax=Meripilus lineatus TaxID=2056292 RepID=A0AAD5YFI7_9APHY|nr:hypothetical protein NLI96_g3601 [Physisporinus lineatus]